MKTRHIIRLGEPPPPGKIHYNSDGDVSAVETRTEVFIPSEIALPGCSPDLYPDWQNLMGIDSVQSVGQLARELATKISSRCAQLGGMIAQDVEVSRYGGRAEIYRWKGTSTIRHIDEPSAYPHRASEPLPLSRAVPIPRRKFYSILPFDLWEIETRIPPCDIPPLPYRTLAKVIYPYGNWRGVYWGIELIPALHLGIIDPVPIRGWRFSGSPVPEIAHLVELRKQNPQFNQALKLLSNKTIGILGSKTTGYKIIENPDDILAGDFEIDENTVRRPYKRALPPYARPQLASFIWASQRAVIGRAIRSIPRDHLIAVHTDGLIISNDSEIAGFREKWAYSEKNWVAPVPGAIWVEGERSQFPGVQRGQWTPGEHITLWKGRTPDLSFPYYTHARGIK